MREAIETTIKFFALLNTIEKDYNALYDEVGLLDKETSDLLHDLEFDTFCGREGYKKAKRLKDLRMRRRNLKNTMEILAPLRDYYRLHSKIKLDLHKVVTQMTAAAKEQSSRVYVPRILNDLKIANQHFVSGEKLVSDITARAG